MDGIGGAGGAIELFGNKADRRLRKSMGIKDGVKTFSSIARYKNLQGDMLVQIVVQIGFGTLQHFPFDQ